MGERKPDGAPDVDEATEEAAAETTKVPEDDEAAGEQGADADDAMSDASSDTEKTPDVTDSP